MEEHNLKPHTIVIDGHVYLDESNRPGLGKRLHDALNGQCNIIGIAKKCFDGMPAKHEAYRGESKKPLYVTTTTTDLEACKTQLQAMHGEHRIPTLLKRADQICRQAAKA